jgi:hypothetical protein
MTYAEIQTLIADNLADGTKIPAVKHRAVELALLTISKLIYHSRAINELNARYSIYKITLRLMD